MKSIDIAESSNVNNMIVFKNQQFKNKALETGMFSLGTGAFLVAMLFDPNTFTVLGTALCACSTLGAGMDMVEYCQAQEYCEDINEEDSKVFTKNMN